MLGLLFLFLRGGLYQYDLKRLSMEIISQLVLSLQYSWSASCCGCHHAVTAGSKREVNSSGSLAARPITRAHPRSTRGESVLSQWVDNR